MVKITLVNMPFADWDRPSFALSQLSALTRREFGDRVELSVHYLNLDFAEYLGSDLYGQIAGNVQHLLTGVGEWMFRELAFPDAAGEDHRYLHRYYGGRQWDTFRQRVTEAREGLPSFFGSLIDRYGLNEADVLGCTSMFAQNVASIALARLVKARRPDVLTVLGGANCEAPMGAVIARNVDAVDAVFSGPALHSFPAFVSRLLDGDADRIHDIPGIVTRKNCTDPRFNTAIGPDRDIDDLILPDYTAFLDAFSARHPDHGTDQDASPVLMFETSRGCWWGQRSHCTFCGLNGLGMGYRAMAPEQALKQFEWLFSQSPRCREFVCTDNILPKNYSREVLPKISTPKGASIFYAVKLPLSNHEMEVMAEAGVTEIQPGVEALSTVSLKLMAKGTTAFLAVQFLKNCVRYGISPNWNLLMGFPGEPEAVYRKYVEDIPGLVHLPPPSGAHMVRFDRYSPYHKDSSRFGLDLRAVDFYRLVYPFDEEEIEQLAYFFTDRSMSRYLTGAINWVEPINELITPWRASWSSASAESKAQLLTYRAADGTPRLLDTRRGDREDIELDEPLHALLRRLESPAAESELLADPAWPEAAAQIAFLREHRLLFEEDGQVLSLVVHGEPRRRTIIHIGEAEPADRRPSHSGTAG